MPNSAAKWKVLILSLVTILTYYPILCRVRSRCAVPPISAVVIGGKVYTTNREGYKHILKESSVDYVCRHRTSPG